MATRFGTCERCGYFKTAEPAFCYECFRRAINALDDSATCGICRHPLDPGGNCGNPLCSRDDRRFAWNRSLGTFDGPFRALIKDYKYHDERNARGRVLGRLLAEFLLEDRTSFEDFDLIIPTPTYIGSGASRSWDHIVFMVQEMASHLDGWPIVTDNRYVAKTRETPSLAREGKTWAKRHAIATTDIRDSLLVPVHPDLYFSSVLVIDDVFTDGHTLNEVARALQQAGAGTVCSLTLARQVYRPSSRDEIPF